MCAWPGAVDNEHAAAAVLKLLVFIANRDLTAEAGSGATIAFKDHCRLLHLVSSLKAT